jgi:hypothetical protein
MPEMHEQKRRSGRLTNDEDRALRTAIADLWAKGIRNVERAHEQAAKATGIKLSYPAFLCRWRDHVEGAPKSETARPEPAQTPEYAPPTETELTQGVIWHEVSLDRVLRSYAMRWHGMAARFEAIVDPHQRKVAFKVTPKTQQE